MNLILLGAPGAGKGTQAELLANELQIPTISTGNILREAIRNQTPIGQMAKNLIDNGQLVPDDVILGIVEERLAREDCKAGYILDGVPRTVAQAEALVRMGIQIDRVISIEIDDAVIVKRMTGRRVCSGCGASYHITEHPPKKDGVCDLCGQDLIIRKDDEPETVLKRLTVYHDQTAPLIGHYREFGKLVSVDGTQSVEAVTEAIINALKA
jgi:adenylate kinase